MGTPSSIVSRMSVDLGALPPLPPLPPPPVILSLTPSATPLSAPLTGESPSAFASAPLTAAFLRGPPSATPAKWLVTSFTRSPAELSAFSPAAFSRPLPASRRRSIASVFAMSSLPRAGRLLGSLLRSTTSRGRRLLGGRLGGRLRRRRLLRGLPGRVRGGGGGLLGRRPRAAGGRRRAARGLLRRAAA